ncbi:anti-anti-sigma regulatory factor, SpoIIAA [Actinobacteria bacterium OV450]|nr:anti-anti-sigma regulatory factor, SpoIIAA [Actinobacteria bacterium OV450]
MTSPSGLLTVVVEPGPQRTRVRVSGEIYTDDDADLRKDLTAALNASPGGLDVDLSGVTFCDSKGLHVLLDLHQQALQAGKTFVLTTLSHPLARLLHITGTQDVLSVQDIQDMPASEAQHGVAGARTGQGRPLDFQMRTRRYGPTVHPTPIGELDMDTSSHRGRDPPMAPTE